MNDENARPEIGPNDKDRERFGFTKRKSRVMRQSSAGILGRAGEDHPIRCTVALSARDENADAAAPIALMPLLDNTLGDPDAKLHLLRAKPAAPRYDFKGRINELTEQNRQLRSALAEEREKRKQLADSLSNAEADINWRLRTVAGEAAGIRRQLDSQGKLAEMVQDAVRSVLRDSAGGGQDSAVRLREEEPGAERSELEAQLEALRRCCSVETSRASRAELLLGEREEELARARQELQELHQALRTERRSGAARADAALERARVATELVRDAGGLLQQQADEAEERFRDLSTAAEHREEELAAELAQALARNRALEAQLVEGAGASA
eukprot:CAMPEP_0179091452 /NCGR_PEP_ID=MMETSP0796-20121207/41777_1 /TAXON_ID=73915 /ORGANISM="Pyrodinium bahamense, Strain pbaha01" /LENGTH=327 /DNA_ID=CAMNT_0020789043 /DNA_START=49 /DNA_END=1032 /DNA_ORIENTATION=-